MAGTVVTLQDVQRAKAEKGDEFGAAIVDLVQNQCDIAALLPFKTLGTVETSDRVSNSIPSVGFRQGRGTSFGSVTRVASQEVKDTIAQLGAQIDIDKTDLRDKEAGDILGQISQQAVKAMAWKFKDTFINGDHATDAYAFEGIKTRLANMPSGQIVYGVNSTTELDIRSSVSPTTAQMYNFLDQIDQAIDQVDGGMPDIALTDGDFIAALKSVLRRLNLYTVPPVQSPENSGFVPRRTFAVKPDRPVLIYPEDRGIKWYNMGLGQDQSTKIIGTDTVNSVACRPVYFMKIGDPYISGIQQYPLEVSSPMLLDDNVTTRITVDWPVGIHHVHNRSVSKLAGVRVA
jgi:hypothetical protein